MNLLPEFPYKSSIFTAILNSHNELGPTAGVNESAQAETYTKANNDAQVVDETRSHKNSSRQERGMVTYNYSRPISRKTFKKFSGLPQEHTGQEPLRNKVKSIHITYISVTCKVARVLTVENMYSSDLIVKLLYLTDQE